MKNTILRSIEEGISAIEQLKKASSLQFLEEVSDAIVTCYLNGHKILIAGNGGSLCDADHFAEELTGYFREKRRALAAISLSNAAHITCCGNDVGFETIFSRAVEAYGKPGDIFIGLTTSGNSPNIVQAMHTASKLGLTTIAFLGKTGGVLKDFADHELLIEGFATSDRIQEAHMTAIHIIIEQVEYRLFLQEHSEKQLLSRSPTPCC